ncbi:MAG TPA: hypothetical protein VJ725_27075 [Thermoanaerobaculia bacterium]|nr:hypothetical protein [Thermoanaerobaculia bacterium]
MSTYEHLAVICGVDRVAPLDTPAADDVFGFGVNLSAALAKGAALPLPAPGELDPWLRTWKWRVTEFVLWGRPKDKDWERIEPNAVPLTPPRRPEPADTDPLVLAVGDRLQKIIRRADGTLEEQAVLWSPAPGEPESGGEDKEQVRHLLASLSGRSTPVPHVLGLSFLLRVPKTAFEGKDFAEIAAVPVFGDGTLGKRAPKVKPATTPPELEPPQERDGILQVAYEDAPAGQPLPPLTAYLLPAPVAIPDHKDFYVDFETGWVKRHPQEAGRPAWAGTDWTVHLEGRAAEAFDLVQRLIDALQEHQEEAALLKKLGESVPLPGGTTVSRLAMVRRIVLAAARDLAGLGLRPAPSGVSLADEIRKRLGNEAAWSTVEAALKTWDQALTLETWAALVAREVPEIAGAAAVSNFDVARPVEPLRTDLDELEQIQSALADDTNLRRLVRAQWSAALEAAPAGSVDPVVRATVLRLLEDHLANTSPRRELSHGNLGAFWKDLIGLDRRPAGEPEPKGVEALVAEQLAKSLATRFPAPAAGAAPDRTPPLPEAAATLAALDDEIKSSRRAFAERLAADLLPTVDDVDEGDSSPTPVPHGVTLPLDRLGTTADRGSEADLKDVQRAVAGYGVLMRIKKDDSPWRCLNMALPALGEKGTTGIEATPVAVPFRLGYRNGMRETAVTYDNHPLVADSPAVGLAGPVTLEEDRQDPLWIPLLHHAPVQLPAEPGSGFEEWARLPALVFGRTYEALPFAVTNAGVLPREIAGNDPTRLRDFGSFQIEPGKPPEKHLRTFRYLRRVRVGPPRYGEGFGRPIPPELLPIPASVAPLTREREVPPDQENEERVPLLLLAPARDPWFPGRDRFQFSIRKPAVDLKTWDRWVAESKDAKELRIKVWTDYHKKAPKELNQTATDDLTIDDPAVSPFFWAQLVALHGGGGTSVSPLRVPIPKPTGTEGLSLVQSPPVPVRCSVGANAGLTAGATGLDVTVPEGQIWELRIFPAVAATLYEKNTGRFHPKAGEALPLLENGGEKLRLQEPLRMRIEVATDVLQSLTPKTLWRALKPEAQGSQIAVRLDKSLDPNFQWVSRVELRRQVWRWNGRPQTFPFAAQPLETANPATAVHREVLKWEAEAFSERSDDDCARKVTAIRLRDEKPLLYDEDRSVDRRALFYRFGVTVFNRYEGLGTLQPVTASAPVAVGSTVETPWRRLLHRCRWTEEVPKPKVKLAVPLTEGRTKDGGVAGLLVVLNEAWHEIGGLAENLKVEIAEVTDPIGPIVRPQIGPDPILTGKGWEGPATAAEIKLEAQGPIGHTFDTGSSAPLFVSTSFLVPPPQVAERDLSWHFAKVSFRRELDPAGLAGSPAGGPLSKPTSPTWVQFLPGSSTWTLQEIGGAKLPDLSFPDDLAVANLGDGSFHLVVRGGGTKVQIDPRPGQTEEGPGKLFQLLLVTRRIQDAGGRPEERYVGLFEFQTNHWTAVDAGAIDKDWELIARVVEIQEQPKQPPQPDPSVWNRLFTGEKDAELRIVRVSPRIPPFTRQD